MKKKYKKNKKGTLQKFYSKLTTIKGNKTRIVQHKKKDLLKIEETVKLKIESSVKIITQVIYSIQTQIEIVNSL